MPQTERQMFHIEIVRNPPDVTATNGRPNLMKDEGKYGCVSLRAPGQKSQSFICVDGDESFQILVTRTERQDDTTYGAVLYLDGQRVHGKKTFRKKTNFPGFKLGGGKFEEFMFAVPALATDPEALQKPKDQHRQFNGNPNNKNSMEEDKLDKKHNGKHGSIIVEFYETEEFERRQMPRQVQQKTYENHFQEDNAKKNFMDGVRIKAGKVFNVPNKFQQQNDNHGRSNNQFSSSRDNGYKASTTSQQNDRRRRDQKDQEKQSSRFQDKGRGGNSSYNNGSRGGHQSSYGNNKESSYRDTRDRDHGDRSRDYREQDQQPVEMVSDHKLKYDAMTDSIEIKYANWATLQVRDLVDIKKYEHLRLAPKALMSATDFITKVLWSVINHKGKIHFRACSKEFQIATTFKLSDFFDFDEDDMKKFLGLRDIFTVDEEGFVTANPYDDKTEFSTKFSRNTKSGQASSGQNSQSTVQNIQTMEVPANQSRNNNETWQNQSNGGQPQQQKQQVSVIELDD